MKRNLYNVLKHVPIIGTVVKSQVAIPELYGSNERSDKFYVESVIEPFAKYMKEHYPDSIPTRKMFYEWLKNNKNDTKIRNIS